MIKPFTAVLIRLPALLLAGLIWILSSQSTLPQPKGIFGWDKLQHFLAFGAVAFFAGLWVSSVRWKTRPIPAFWLTALTVSAYGATDELHQYFVPGRFSSVWDWLADTIGALLGTLVIMLFVRKMKTGVKTN